MIRRYGKNPVAHLILALLGAIPTGIALGPNGLAGYGLGILGAGVNWAGLYAITFALVASAENRPSRFLWTATALMAFPFKLIVLLLCGFTAQRLPDGGLTGFFVAVGMVYLCLVIWAQAKVND